VIAFALGAATHPLTIHPYVSAGGHGTVHDNSAAMAGATGTIDAAGADDRIDVFRLKRHGRGKGQDGGYTKQE
jgi:hypothetical protein